MRTRITHINRRIDIEAAEIFVRTETKRPIENITAMNRSETIIVSRKAAHPSPLIETFGFSSAISAQIATPII
jgi:hypothetical protein